MTRGLSLIERSKGPHLLEYSLKNLLEFFKGEEIKEFGFDKMCRDYTFTPTGSSQKACGRGCPAMSVQYDFKKKTWPICFAYSRSIFKKRFRKKLIKFIKKEIK